MLCDDTEEIRQYLRFEIEMDPLLHVVGEAVNGKEAIDLAAKLQPDVILLDLSMPVMSGPAALPHIRRVSPNTKVIVLSGLSWREAAAQLPPGVAAERFIEKGTSVRSILDAVRQICGVEEESPLSRLVGSPVGELFERSLDLLCIANTDGYFLHLSPSWEKVLGWTVHDLTSKPFIAFVHPDDREPTVNVTEELGAGRDALEFENRYVCKDGTYRWLSWLVGGARPDGLLFARARDITAEKAVRDERETLAAIVRSSFDAIVGLDLNGDIRTWNPAAEVLYGYSSEEVLGAHISLVAPDPDEVYDFLARARLGEVSRLETTRLTKTGAEVDVMLTVSPTHASNGSVIGTSHIAMDITERKRAELAATRMHEELEDRVWQRTRELEERTQELQTKAEELQRSMAELDSFAYTVSHDLKAPLRAMDGFSRILLEHVREDADPDQARYLSFIRENAQSMQKLVDGLLAFARLGRRGLQPVRLAPEILVNQAISDLGSSVERERLVIQVKTMPDCWADPTLLKQVFVNLLGNSAKFTRTVDAAHVEVGAIRDDGRTVYYVRDNGIGFEQKYADRVFGVFQRLHRAEDYEGTGIGLANVQRIIEKHAGTVWCESEVGDGTTFFFTLGLEEGASE